MTGLGVSAHSAAGLLDCAPRQWQSYLEHSQRQYGPANGADDADSQQALGLAGIKVAVDGQFGSNRVESSQSGERQCDGDRGCSYALSEKGHTDEPHQEDQQSSADALQEYGESSNHHLHFLLSSLNSGRADARLRQALRAAPRASYRVTAMRLDPSRLRACGVAHFACLRGKAPRGLSPPRGAWLPLNTAEPACVGSAAMAVPPLRVGFRPRSSAPPCCIRARWRS